jgi:acetyl esterase/lipase
VAADYRLAPQTRFPGILEDCKSAIDFIQSSPLFKSATKNSVDSSRLIVSGGSAGGWLSLLAGTGIGYSACGLQPPSGIIAVAAIYPISDILDPFWTTKQHPVSYVGRVIGREEVEPFISPLDVKAAFSPVDDRRGQFYAYMLQECVLTPVASRWFFIDLLTFFRAILGSLLLDDTNIPPSAFSIAANLKSRPSTDPLPMIYITHGNKDDKVPHRQSTDVVDALKEIKAQVEYHEMDGYDHLFDKEPDSDMTSMYEFIDRVL